MSIASLALKSLRNRKTTAVLTIFSIAVSVALLLGVERVRVEAKNSFTSTISGTDLIVGARSSSINLLLYSVFHIGNATNNITWQTYEELSSNPAVAWTVPIALGDSHQGYRVVGTTQGMFDHYRYANDQSLSFKSGAAFDDLYDAVIGSEVALALGYSVGQPITLSHGVEATSLQEHDDKPFVISGILEPTGTPMDRVIMISLEGIEALHIDWVSGAPPIPGFTISADRTRQMDLQPTSITAYFVGLKSRVAAFRYQRMINDYRQEALSAILPGVALQELWRLVGSAEKALLAVSVMVVLAGLIGMLTTILTSLNERRREMAILRSVGARPGHIFALMVSESLIYAIAGTALGFALQYGLLFAVQPSLQKYFGFYLAITAPGAVEWLIASIVIGSATILGIIPAWRAYRNSLADGLTVRL
ncbi:peptide ABC transporter permease [Endozoicomonas montiporae]|uniref:Peptide ABC transporter permease n=2 Tax=Endozoicomonas montiporae TaxID=1027273 RepID=A0A081N8W7_9GAMM|nr:FtsX-like permease family protein [Endozoicomonas montiporae]AMO55188.1 ABC transport system permease protein [Endozoicomonas montiporae CL-33]KEQ14890.1 peptide ABC transporter permease [Endozoicomonas montiporae]